LELSQKDFSLARVYISHVFRIALFGKHTASWLHTNKFKASQITCLTKPKDKQSRDIRGMLHRKIPLYPAEPQTNEADLSEKIINNNNLKGCGTCQ